VRALVAAGMAGSGGGGTALAGDGGCRLNVAAMSVAGSWWRLAWPDPVAAGLDLCPSPLTADGDRAGGCRGGEGAVVLRALRACVGRVGGAASGRVSFGPMTPRTQWTAG
jgi:hypothetical protein